jgi:hypothetical protein
MSYSNVKIELTADRLVQDDLAEAKAVAAVLGEDIVVVQAALSRGG